MSRTNVWRAAGWGVFVAAIGICTLIPLLAPAWIDRTRPGTILSEDGLFEQFQWPWYFAGAAILLWGRSRARPGWRGYLALTAFAVILLGQREADADRIFLGQRWYNPGRFLSSKEDVPTYGRIALSILLPVIVICGTILVIKGRQSVRDWYAHAKWKLSHLLVALSFACLAFAVACDKHRTVAKHLHVNLRLRNGVYIEETFELLGAILLFIACIEMASAATAADPAPALNAETRTDL